MQNHENVKKIEEKRFEQDRHNSVRIVDAHVEARDKLIEMLPKFECIWNDHGGTLTSQIIESNFSRRLRSLFTVHRTGRARKHPSLESPRPRVAECCRKE